MIPLLVATLEGEAVELEAPEVLGRSFLGRMKRRAGNVASHQVRNIGHGVANVGRATGRVGMQLSRGNVKGAFVDLGRAVTTTVTTPVTMAVGAVSKSAGRKLEGVIRRNDPAALLNRKIFEAVKAAVRPIVAKFAGELEDELEAMGEDAQQLPTTKRAALRAARGKILAASTAAGTAAGTSVAGPYGAPVGAALVPAAVDAIIDEIGNKDAGKPGAASAASPAAETVTAGNGSGIPKAAIVGAVAVGAFLLLRRKE